MPGRFCGFWKGALPLPERIETYLNTVGEQIRWKRARPALLRELRTHALEQLDACLEAGMEEESAQAETVRQLGDPLTVGRELDSVHRPRPQWGLLALITALALAGTLLYLFLMPGGHVMGRLPPAPEKTLLFFGLGMAGLWLGYFLDYTRLGRWAAALYGLTLAAGVLLLCFGREVNHAAIDLRRFSLLFPLAYGLLLYALRGRGWTGFMLALLGAAPLLLLTGLAPSMLGLILLLFSGGVLLLLCVREDHFGLGRRAGLGAFWTLAALVLILFALSLGRPLLHRLELGLHPELDPQGMGYLPHILRLALSGAQWWGEGQLGGSLAGLDYWKTVPLAEADAFLVTVIHFLGLIPALLLLAALLGLLLWLTAKAVRQKNFLGRLVAAAVLPALGLQMLFSVLLNFGLVFTGADCPLLMMNFNSVMDLALLGLLLSVFRESSLPYTPPAPAAKRPRGRWHLVYVPAGGANMEKNPR